MPLIFKLRFFPFGSFGPRDIRIKQRSSLAAGFLFPSFLVFFPGIIPCQRDGSFRLNSIFHIDSMSSKISKKVKTLQCPLDLSKEKIFRLLFGMVPSESDLIAAYSDQRMILICNTFTNQKFNGANMDYAGKVWIAICGGFILLVGVLSANGGLTWTDKVLQLKQAQTRVIDLNAVPEQGINKIKY